MYYRGKGYLYRKLPGCLSLMEFWHEGVSDWHIWYGWDRVAFTAVSVEEIIDNPQWFGEAPDGTAYYLSLLQELV